MADNENIVKQSNLEKISVSIPEVTEGDFLQLKSAAEEFIRIINKQYQNSLHTKQLIQTENLKNGLQYFYQYMRENTNFTQTILPLQHEFESRVNTFLGRKIYLAWVDDKGKIFYKDEINIGQIYKKAFGQFGRGGISQSVITKTSDIEKTLKERFEKAQNLRIGVYQQIRRRWLEPKNKNRFFYLGYYRSNFNRRRYTRPFPKLGGIAEGYVDAVINEDEQTVWHDTDRVKQQLAIRKLYENHIDLNSTAALIKGDVVFNKSEGKIHFAVKEGKFSTAKFGQYYALAQNIKKQEKLLTKEELQKNIPSMIRIDDLTRITLDKIYQKATTEVQNQIKELKGDNKI